MKKFSIVAFVFAIFSFTTFSSYAQTGDDTTDCLKLGENQTYQELFDSVCSGLIKTRIPYGVLYERVIHLDDVRNWHNGDTTDKDKLFQDWWNMEHSNVYGTTEGSYETMRAGVDTQTLTNQIPILYINYSLSTIDSAAFDDGRMGLVNGIMTDNNLPLIPYSTINLRTGGVPINSVAAQDPINFFFDSSLYSFSNNGIAVTNILVHDATENINFSITPGTAFSQIFTIEGQHTLKFDFQLADASTLSVYELLTVSEPRQKATAGTGCDVFHDFIKSTIPFQGYTESYPTTSWGDYHIYYHFVSQNSNNCEPVLRKPVIICDGYDPEDKRHYFDIYKLLQYGSGSANFGDDLRHQGYDIVILNFPVLGNMSSWSSSVAVPKFTDKASGSSVVPDPNAHTGRDGGVDYIERNAFVLVALIQKINAELSANNSSEKLVVVGPSMGGQITRYGLAYMEKQQALYPNDASWNPNTRLWLSFDSPHWGANIPLATQRTLYWFGYNAGQTAARDAFEKKIYCPAGRELLIEQLGAQNNTDAIRQQYLYNLEHNGLTGAYGWPSYRAPGGNIRKIALVNGSGNGAITGNLGQQYIDAKGAGAGITLFKLDTRYLGAPNTSGTYFSATNTTYKAFGPGIGHSTSWLFGGFFFQVQPSHAYATYNSNQQGAMDVVPGSTYNSTQDIKDQFTLALNDAGITTQTWNIIPAHTFIPTISALGFIDPKLKAGTTLDWNAGIDDRNLVCTNEIPFDNYYVPNENQPHITLTVDNVAWLNQEIAKGQSNCPVICATDITGSSAICSSQTKTYTINGTIPTGTVVTWSVGSYVSLASTSMTSANVSYAGGPGNSFVRADITNGCGADFHLVKPIIAGLPASTFTIRTIDPCQGEGNAIAYSGVTYNWYTSAVGAISGPSNIFCCATRNANITLSLTNACGTTSTTTHQFLSTLPPGISCTQKVANPNPETTETDVVVLPNPTNDSWNINFRNPEKTPVRIELADITGRRVMAIAVQNTFVETLSCADLAAGCYITKIFYQDGSECTIRLVKSDY